MKSKLVTFCAIALTVLIVIMAFVHPVQAHEAGTDSGNIEKPVDYPTGQNEYGYLLISGFTTGTYWNGYAPISGGLSMDFSPDIEKICLYKDGNGSNDGGTWTRYRVASSYEEIEANYVYNWHFGSDPGRFAVSDIVMHEITKSYVYIFNTGSEASQYLSGNLDAKNALNYEDVQESLEANRSYSYDGTYPYFDKSSMVVNKNNTVTYNAAMSEEQRNRYYDLLAMDIDKEGTGTDSHRIAYMEYYCTAVYADSSQLGIFNNFMLQYGSRDTGFINTSKIPNANKVDEIIQFDPNGRLKVSGYYGIQGHKHSSGFSGFLGNSPFAWSDDSALMAVELDSATPSDKLTVTPSFQKLLQSDDKITDITQYGTLLGGGVAKVKNYTLIGYACDVRIVVLENGEYKYSKDTYTYTWLNSAMRDRYGASTSTYDDNGNKSPDSYHFDGNGEETDGTLNNGFEYNMDGIQGFIKSGFRLLDANGFLSLIGNTMNFIPAWVWLFVEAVIAIYVSFLLFKLLVKFL